MTVVSPLGLPLLGAYAMAPADPAEQRYFYAALADLPLRGLEIPLPVDDASDLWPGQSTGTFPVRWDLMVTCIPTVMGRLGAQAAYGLASREEEARRTALADVRRAADLAVRLAESSGRTRVVAIEVHSAPGPELGSADALARSLGEILTWDLAGADLLVEHCDAPRTGQAAAKGFLSFDEELATLAAVRTEHAAGAPGPGGRVGMAVNWGRSAIEGRSARTPVDHVTAAAHAGLLGAVVLSGATDADTAWGPAWGDAHIPPRGEDAALEPSSDSLLDAPAVREVFGAGGGTGLLAVKVSARPKDADLAARLAVARACLDLVAAAR